MTPERVGIAGVKVKGSGGPVREEGQCQQTADASRGSFGPEARPAGVVAQVGGVEAHCVGDGVQAGAFVVAALEGVEVDHDGIGMDRGRGGAPWRAKTPTKSHPSMVDTARLNTWAKVSPILPAENRAAAVREKSTVNAPVGSSSASGGSVLAMSPSSVSCT
jgi:hypothetical protein